MSEKRTQTEIMLDLGCGSSRLFRNNCGTAKFPNGSTVKYGIANPGGSDLIGFTSVTITPDMVGQTVAIFTAIEVKDLDGRVGNQQANFINFVRNAGGRAGIARSVQDARAIAEGK